MAAFIVKMGCQPVAGGKGIPGALRQMAGPGGALVKGKITPAVLPGVQGTDRPALGVQVDNAVHLPGDPNGLHVGKTAQQLLKTVFHLLPDFFRVLDPLPGLPRKKGVVFDVHCLRNPGTGIPDDGGDGGGSDINAQCFHMP